MTLLEGVIGMGLKSVRLKCIYMCVKKKRLKC